MGTGTDGLISKAAAVAAGVVLAAVVVSVVVVAVATDTNAEAGV